MKRLTVASAFLCVFAWRAAQGQYYAPGPPLHAWETPCVTGECQPNTYNYGFYQTHWRRWPTSLPRVEPGPASRGGGIESLPRVETPDPRFEGEISPPIDGRSPAPPPDVSPDNVPDARDLELPAPDPFSPVPPDPRNSSRNRVDESLRGLHPFNPQARAALRMDVPPPPATVNLSYRPASEMVRPIVPEAAAFPAIDSMEPLPSREGGVPHSSPGQIILAAHERPTVDLKIVAPASSAIDETTSEIIAALNLPECVIEEEAATPSPIPKPAPLVIVAPVSPRRSPPHQPGKPRDLLFDSLRVTPPARDPLFKAIR
jgi:hypothetical protein